MKENVEFSRDAFTVHARGVEKKESTSAEKFNSSHTDASRGVCITCLRSGRRSVYCYERKPLNKYSKCNQRRILSRDRAIPPISGLWTLVRHISCVHRESCYIILLQFKMHNGRRRAHESVIKQRYMVGNHPYRIDTACTTVQPFT